MPCKHPLSRNSEAENPWQCVWQVVFYILTNECTSYVPFIYIYIWVFAIPRIKPFRMNQLIDLYKKLSIGKRIIWIKRNLFWKIMMWWSVREISRAAVTSLIKMKEPQYSLSNSYTRMKKLCIILHPATPRLTNGIERPSRMRSSHPHRYQETPKRRRDFLFIYLLILLFFIKLNLDPRFMSNKYIYIYIYNT